MNFGPCKSIAQKLSFIFLLKTRYSTLICFLIWYDCRGLSISCSKACHCADSCQNRPFRKDKKIKVVKACLFSLSVSHELWTSLSALLTVLDYYMLVWVLCRILSSNLIVDRQHFCVYILIIQASHQIYNKIQIQEISSLLNRISLF